MARPKNKTDLVQQSEKSFADLQSFITSLSEAQQHQAFPAQYMNRNIRDVLGHIHAWHLLFLRWYAEGMAGMKPIMPAEGYTWKTTPDLNRMIQEKYSQTPFSEVQKMVLQSYHDVQQIITVHSDEELFTKKRYAWTGTSSLGQYLISATCSHYEWALRLTKKALK